MAAPKPPHIPDDVCTDVTGVDPLVARTETDRAKAFARFHIIRPFLEEGVPLSVVAKHHDIPWRTAQNWVRAYRESGLAALCRKPRRDKGHRRALSAELVQVVEGLALHKPRPSAATIHRRLVEITAQQGLQAPSYDMVHEIVQHMDPALLMLAHEGSKVYGDTFELLYRREAEAPNDIWQADHTLLDIMLNDDKGQAKKPWLTMIMDDYSRAVAGYMLTFDAPSALHTALALRQAIWRKAEPTWQVSGIPAILYTDHGSDFTSKHLEHVCLDLKIRAIFSQVGKPRGRGRIERFFNTINQMLLARLPGYAPAGFATQVTPGLDLQGLNREFKRFILSQYHQTPHSSTGVAPQLRWHEGGFLPHMPESLEQLDLLLLTVAKPRIVHRDGIRFQGLRYIDTTLAAYIGEQVIVRYDSRDMAEIRVYYRQRFLCRAICQELAGETVGLKDIIRARRRRKRDLQQQINTRQSLVDQLLASSTPRPPGAESMPTPPPTASRSVPLKRYEHD